MSVGFKVFFIFTYKGEEVLYAETMGHVCAKPKFTDKTSIYELVAKDIDGNERKFSEWNNKVVMLLNVASQ